MESWISSGRGRNAAKPPIFFVWPSPSSPLDRFGRAGPHWWSLQNAIAFCFLVLPLRASFLENIENWLAGAGRLDVPDAASFLGLPVTYCRNGSGGGVGPRWPLLRVLPITPFAMYCTVNQAFN